MDCPSCGTTTQEWAQQCPSCGAEMRSAAAPWGPPAGGAQPGGWGPPGGSEWNQPIHPPPGSAWGGPPPAGRAGRYAGWWYRVGATVIDNIIVGVVEGILFASLGVAAGVILTLAFSFAYVSLLIARNGQTVGMMALGTRAGDAGTGATLPYPRSALRWVIDGLPAVLVLISPVFVLLGFLVLLDYLWPLWDNRKQTLHDKLADSLVVHVR
jgi:uncharacterized RDD family membrane protein YckC